ncbi:YhgE/Pip domain-containing protein [Gracilibacillus caseinilyticus]|uniref:YhgE/Pip domain-containing protein n=1 Tax=Gracilibacillus caseinilyticus TaxID=2932256 RepID=A0ABY4EXV6_9BACI|nr:YhgE/Pip domain-containing protein [Gracilibacillus caseinilyticus]UOQ46991.1 YhgE/Pip domain-containing protein [Gracilibacillus caseinilyticus]
MMKTKRLAVIGMATLLVFPVSPVHAQDNVEKEEVVYATLDPTGSQNDMYVVNSFELSEPSDVTDYGDYTKVQNLTDQTEIAKDGNEMSFSTDNDQFYYQGDLEDKALPWNFDISYTLDGESIKPDQLLGKDGHVKIEITPSVNENVNQVFSENYLLQISVTVDAALYQNLQAPEGTLANAGKNKQVSFTMMPDQVKSFVLEADVENFELEAIDFSAVPSSMSIESPNMDDVTKDFKSLADATAEVNDGVGELANGISELNNGVVQLQDGSAAYKNGITELDNGSDQLVNGSASIKNALNTMKSSLDVELGGADFSELQNGLEEIAKGLDEAAGGLTQLQENYQQAYNALEESINAIPSNVSEDEMKALQAAVKDNEQNAAALKKLLKTYEAAQAAKGTYDQVNKAFSAVSPTLKEVDGSLTKMAESIRTMASEMAKATEDMNIESSINQLTEGITQLSNKYNDFHSGLVEYTNGVGELSNAYGEVHSGITELADGTQELENGANELHDGTTELADSTSDLPDQVQQEIDDMINEYDKSDFEAESFVSDKNENVKSVQFVIKTESITYDDENEDENSGESEEKKGIWQRFLDLFR